MDSMTSIALLALAALVGQDQAAAPPPPARFSVRVLGNLRTPSCAFPEQALAINERGECAGSICRLELARAAHWSQDGSFTLVDLSKEGPDSFASDIDDEGVVVGYSIAGYRVQAFRWTAEDKLTALDLEPGMLPLAIGPGGTVAFSSATGPALRSGLWSAEHGTTWIEGLEGDIVVRDMSAAGVVTGLAGGGAIPVRAFRWTPQGGALALATPRGFLHAHGNGINAAGVVVGLSRDAARDQATRWDPDGGSELLPYVHEGSRQSVAHAVNDRGWIVGAEHASADTFERSTAVLWIDGVAYELDSLVDQPRGDARVHVSIAFDVNSKGQIAASGRFGDELRAVRLDPR